jgi:hypothetical protein
VAFPMASIFVEISAFLRCLAFPMALIFVEISAFYGVWLLGAIWANSILIVYLIEKYLDIKKKRLPLSTYQPFTADILLNKKGLENKFPR